MAQDFGSVFDQLEEAQDELLESAEVIDAIDDLRRAALDLIEPQPATLTATQIDPSGDEPLIIRHIRYLTEE